MPQVKRLSRSVKLYARRLIRDEWLNSGNLNALDKAYLYNDIANSNLFFISTWKSGKPLDGLLLARIGWVNPFHKLKWLFKYYFWYFISLFQTTKAERLDAVIEYQMNKKLMVDRHPCKAEVVLFMVDKQSRHLGIGTELISSFENLVSECTEIQVFTDTYSNYKFYLKRNYKIIDLEREPETDEEFYRLIKIK